MTLSEPKDDKIEYGILPVVFMRGSYLLGGINRLFGQLLKSARLKKSTIFLWTALLPFSVNGQADWPAFVAPEGCTFEWHGTDDYFELAHSFGPAQFPQILFSRDDWGPEVTDFVPFCGVSCLRPAGRAALRGLFPLDVGNTQKFEDFLGETQMVVKAREVVEPLGVEAFLVETTQPNGATFQSWWSVDIGWIVAYQAGDFRKTVVRYTCDGGLV